MSEVILHHYELSPFSEKVRLALGVKNASWRSVDIPAAPPRPLLTPLTGGYRRTPVLQIGADIYCDTNIILPAIDRLLPGPTLYPAAFNGLQQALGFNWERSIWIPAIGILVHFLGDLPDDFLKDRKDGYLYIDISKNAMEPEFELNVQRMRGQLAFLKTALSDGRRFLFGDTPSALDLAYYHPLSLIRKNSPPADVDRLLSLDAIVPWYERIAGIGHGRPSDLAPDAALQIAAKSQPADVAHIADNGGGPGPERGAAVTVTPDDNAKVPVTGTLVAADETEIVIHRHDGQAGDIHIHFPRAGFEIKPA